ncbi:MAG: hypothetical protein EB010_08070, partial [Acidimicrobiia bacterium]|nr:hypothetical protein [Acidimicrobiia bacterium]
MAAWSEAIRDFHGQIGHRGARNERAVGDQIAKACGQIAVKRPTHHRMNSIRADDQIETLDTSTRGGQGGLLRVDAQVGHLGAEVERGIARQSSQQVDHVRSIHVEVGEPPAPFGHFAQRHHV